MPGISATIWRFQCSECGFGDAELGHLTTETETHCVLCLEEDGRRVTLHWWEADAQPVRLACAAA